MHLRFAYVLTASAFFVAAGSWQTSTFAQADLTYEKAIANLKANETLYENLDVSCVATYSHLAAATPIPHAIRKYRTDVRTVLQGRKLFLDYKRAGEEFDGTPYSESVLYGYDGAVARILQDDAVANIRDDAPFESRVFRPHRMCLSWPVRERTLSEFLTCKEVDRRAVAWSLESPSVDLDGVRCCIVRGDFYLGATAESPISSRLDLWLACDRNYLPAKVEAYRTWDEPKLLPLPVSMFQVTEWKEAIPGRWMPISATEVGYDVRALAAQGKQVEELVTKYAIQDVNFDPAHGDAFFRDVPFPPNAIVYEVEGGEIVKSYRASDRPETQGLKPDEPASDEPASDESKSDESKSDAK